MSESTLKVLPENREKFEKAMLKWKTLIDVIGWQDLCMMYIQKIPLLQDRPELSPEEHSSEFIEAKIAILRMICDDLRDNGLEGNIV